MMVQQLWKFNHNLNESDFVQKDEPKFTKALSKNEDRTFNDPHEIISRRKHEKLSNDQIEFLKQLLSKNDCKYQQLVEFTELLHQFYQN